MDYTLPALKLFVGQLKGAKPKPTPDTNTNNINTTSSSSSAMVLGQCSFQRAWLQGVLVSGIEQGNLVMDDGTGVVDLILPKDFQGQSWNTGMYILVVGAYCHSTATNAPMIKVHKIVDLSPYPDRESMWLLEVLESNHIFYGFTL